MINKMKKSTRAAIYSSKLLSTTITKLIYTGQKQGIPALFAHLINKLVLLSNKSENYLTTISARRIGKK